MVGLVIAVVAVLSSALQQIMCGAMQRKHLVSSHQLLSNTAHIQVLSDQQLSQPRAITMVVVLAVLVRAALPHEASRIATAAERRRGDKRSNVCRAEANG